jgi:hypothetical protein
MMILYWIARSYSELAAERMQEHEPFTYTRAARRRHPRADGPDRRGDRFLSSARLIAGRSATYGARRRRASAALDAGIAASRRAMAGVTSFAATGDGRRRPGLTSAVRAALALRGAGHAVARRD